MPLSLGATPAQVFIDGVKQLASPHVVSKPKDQSVPPSTSDAIARSAETIEAAGDTSYAPKKSIQDVVFVNVRSAFGVDSQGQIEQTFGPSHDDVDAQASLGTVVVKDSEIVCAGSCEPFAAGILDIVDLKGGSLIPGLVTYGAPMGVTEMPTEKSTKDGEAFDVIQSAGQVPDVLKGEIIKGVEALSLGQKDLQCVPFLISP